MKNRIGETFGKLTVIERAENINGRVAWLCECECGKKKVIRTGDLLKERKDPTCGECNNEYHNMLYEFKDGYVIAHVKSGRCFYIDEEDLFKIKDFSFTMDKKGYVQFSNKGKTIPLHRYLMNPNDSEVVDHINRKPYDNRKRNLRVCTQMDNIKNSTISKNNKSGIIGVYFRKRERKWTAEITVNGKKKYLKSFKEFEDAVRTRLAAEKEYFKEFAPQSHLFKKYNIT